MKIVIEAEFDGGSSAFLTVAGEVVFLEELVELCAICQHYEELRWQNITTKLKETLEDDRDKENSR